MTNEQVIEKLIDQINNNMQIFLGILGVLVAIFAFFQWRISQSQLKDLKEKAKVEAINDIVEKYKLDNLKESYKKIESLEKQFSILESKNNELRSSIESLENIRQVRLIQDIQATLKLALSDNSEKPSTFEGRLTFLLSEFINNAFIQDIVKMSTLGFVFNEVNALKDSKPAQRIKEFVESSGKKYLDQWNELAKNLNDKTQNPTQEEKR